MNTSGTQPFIEMPPLHLVDLVDRGKSLFTAAEARDAEAYLLDALEAVPEGGLLPVHLEGVRLSSEAARQLLRRALLRIRAGELTDRYLVLGDLGESLYNVEIMLSGEELVVVERADEEGVQLRGDVDPAMLATHRFLCTTSGATASAVQQHFGLNNISTATNRLTSLTKRGLARRVQHRAVAGGGREFVYAAVR